MSENPEDTSMESAPELRIKRFNSDKTRKDFGSDTVYHVYFELSRDPPPEWRDIFGREWKRLNLTQEAGIDGTFLVLHCQIQEVASMLLPALKKAVGATNAAYKEYVQKEAAALELREDVWREERKGIEALGASLRFE